MANDRLREEFGYAPVHTSRSALEEFVTGIRGPRVLTPDRAPGTGFTVANAGNLAGVLSNLGLVALPAELAGRIRLPVQPGFETVGAYGGGLTTFAVLGVRGSAGRRLIPDA